MEKYNDKDKKDKCLNIILLLIFLLVEIELEIFAINKNFSSYEEIDENK